MTLDAPRALARLGARDARDMQADGPLAHVSIAPDGSALAAASSRLRVWALPERTLRFEGGHTSWGHTPCWLPDSSGLLLTGATGIFRADLATSDTTLLVESEGDALRVAVAATRPIAVWGDDAGNVGGIHLDTGAPLEGLPKKHRASVYGVALNADGTMLATASGKVGRIWRLDGKRASKALPLRGASKSKGLATAEFSPDGSVVVMADHRKTFFAWDTTSGELLWSTYSTSTLAFAPDGASVWACVHLSQDALGDGTPRGYHVARLDLRTGLPQEGWPMEVTPRQLAWDPRGERLALMSGQHTTIAFYNTDGTPQLPDLGHHDRLRAVARSSDEGGLITMGWDRRMIRWEQDDADPDQLAYTQARLASRGAYDGVHGAAASFKRPWVATAEGLYARLRDADTLEVLAGWSGKKLHSFNHAAWLRDGALLWASSLGDRHTHPRGAIFDTSGLGALRPAAPRDVAPLEVARAFDPLPFSIYATHIGEDAFVAVGTEGALHVRLDTLETTRVTRFEALGNSRRGAVLWCDLRSDGLEALVHVRESASLVAVDVETGAHKARHVLEDIELSSACYDVTGALVLVFDKRGQLHIVDNRNGERLGAFELEPHAGREVRGWRHPDGSQRLITSDSGGAVVVWDAEALTPPEIELVEPAPNDQLADLRALLYAETIDADAWKTVCAHLDGWGEGIEVALDYAQAHLDAWPEAVRTLPKRWASALCAGAREPRASLAREAVVDDVVDANMPHLVNAPELALVVELMVSGKKLTNAGAAHFERAAAWVSLRRFTLARAGVRVRGARALAKAPFLKTLERLCISHTPIGAGGAAALVGAKALERLRELKFFSCALSGSSQHAFYNAWRDAEHLGGLERLDLSYCNHLDISRIVSAPFLSNLKEFRAAEYRSNIHNPQSVFHAEHLTALTHVSLYGHLFSDADLLALCDAPYTPNLVELDIDLRRDVAASSVDRVLAAATGLDEHWRSRLLYKKSRLSR